MQSENPVSLLFRARLQALLSERGVSQRQLAMDTGLTQQSVNNYLRGVTKLPGAQELLALARYFCVPMESLLGADGVKEKGGPAAPPAVSAAEVRRAVGRVRQAAEKLRVEVERLERLGGGHGEK